MSKKAIILFSGGLDSTTCLAIAKAQNYLCYTLSFIYGQKHEIEIEQARKIAQAYGVIKHKILHLPLNEIGSSSLTDTKQIVADYQPHVTTPATYVSARNTIFLSFALAWGETLDITDFFIGANYIDYSGYPDCRPAYLEAFERMAALATNYSKEQGIKIHAPLLHWNKAEIIREGMRLGVDYTQTISCYRADNEGRACGVCDSCVYRKKGFIEANIPDQTRYY